LQAFGRGDDILLINRKEGLPIDAPCQAKQESEPNDDYQQATRSDESGRIEARIGLR
jgi:hypothetical protein